MAEPAGPGETASRPRIHDILTADELKGLARDAGMSESDLAKAMAPIAGLPSGVMQVAIQAGDAFGRSFGFKSVKTAELALAASYPAAVRGLVFALSGLGYAVTTAFDTPGGAYFEAQLPRDFFSMGGTLQFDLADRGANNVQIAGTSEIRGQKFDWGKGKRALGDVLAKTETFARRLGG